VVSISIHDEDDVARGKTDLAAKRATMGEDMKPFDDQVGYILGVWIDYTFDFS
jgi:hypothetical protein